MRHARILRFLLPSWHKKEREISLKIRDQILNQIPKRQKSDDIIRKNLKILENIKGYREVRYQKATEAFASLQ
ncbi:hypothetical protein M901_1915 [Bacteriovorax sp. DB6_IX]|nr:hypothetical protein M901_1915 [Bacteriovorax sp. DB6_IX]